MSAQDIRLIYLLISFTLLFAGGVSAIVSFFRLILLAMKRSWMWALGILVFPPAGAVYAFMNWEDTHHTFMSIVKGILLCVLSTVLIIFYS